MKGVFLKLKIDRESSKCNQIRWQGQACLSLWSCMPPCHTLHKAHWDNNVTGRTTGEGGHYTWDSWSCGLGLRVGREKKRWRGGKKTKRERERDRNRKKEIEGRKEGHRDIFWTKTEFDQRSWCYCPQLPGCC